MPVLGEDGRAAGGDGQRYCSCLPFRFWGAEAAPGKKRRRRRRRRWRCRCRLRLRLSWLTFSWPWLRKSGGGNEDAGGEGTKKGKKGRRGRRLLLLLTASLQPKKALASVVSGDGSLLPAKASSFGDAKKLGRSKPRPKADAAAPNGPPQSSTTGTRGSTAPARARLEWSQPSPRSADSAGRIWRAPSRRHALQPDRAERPAGAGGLWTAATTLGVIVLFGRVTAVVFLCSCLYGARFVRARGDAVLQEAVELRATEELKKKVVMAGLLDRAGKGPSSRFGRIGGQTLTL